MRKHICFLASAFNREDPLIVYRQAFSLIKEGYQVSYLLRDGQPDEVKYGIYMRSIGAKASSTKERIKTNSKLFKLFLQDYKADIYQISEPELLNVGLWLKRHGKTVVFNLREWYPDYYANRINSKLLKKIIHFTLERYLNYVAKRIDAVFNCMPEMHEYIEKIMPCNYFTDTANFPIVNEAFSLKFEDYCARENIISYFGSIYNISCQEEFLDAISFYPNVKYLLAGVFYDESYHEKLKNKKSWNQVQFINGFTRKQLPEIVNSSIMGHVVKDFSKTETPEGSYSIIKIFETMEAAVPVILSKVPLYEDMVEKYHCGICIDPYSVEDWKNAIGFLLTHKKAAYEMGQNGRRAVLEEFSWDSQAKNYLHVINELKNKRE